MVEKEIARNLVEAALDSQVGFLSDGRRVVFPPDVKCSRGRRWLYADLLLVCVHAFLLPVLVFVSVSVLAVLWSELELLLLSRNLPEQGLLRR